MSAQVKQHFVFLRAGPVNNIQNSSSLPVMQLQSSASILDVDLHYCSLCGKAYKNRFLLKRHTTYECGDARNKFSCVTCGRKFSRPDNLLQHERIVHFKNTT